MDWNQTNIINLLINSTKFMLTASATLTSWEMISASVLLKLMCKAWFVAFCLICWKDVVLLYIFDFLSNLLERCCFIWWYIFDFFDFVIYHRILRIPYLLIHDWQWLLFPLLGNLSLCNNSGFHMLWKLIQGMFKSIGHNCEYLPVKNNFSFNFVRFWWKWTKFWEDKIK